MFVFTRIALFMAFGAVGMEAHLSIFQFGAMLLIIFALMLTSLYEGQRP